MERVFKLDHSKWKVADGIRVIKKQDLEKLIQASEIIDAAQKEAAKDATRTAKLNIKLKSLDDKLSKEFENLGRKYYESHKDDDSAESRRIQEIYTEISDTKDELADIRGEVVCPKCGEYVPKNAKFCPNCGNDMNVFEESDTVDAEAFEEEDADDTETVNPAEDDKTDNQPKEN